MSGKPKRAYAEPIVTDKPHGTLLYRSRTPCRCEVCTTATSASRASESAAANDIHGTAGRYRAGGCRCDLCREANRLARRKAREERYAERIKVGGRWFHPKVGLLHATAWAYQEHGCRCDACRKFAARQTLASKQRRTGVVASGG